MPASQRATAAHDADHELCLGQLSAGHLMGHMHHGIGLRESLVAKVRFTIHENPLPWDQDIVKNDHRIHLLIARGQGGIKMRFTMVIAVSADHLETWGGDGNGKGESKGNIAVIGPQKR